MALYFVDVSQLTSDWTFSLIVVFKGQALYVVKFSGPDRVYLRYKMRVLRLNCFVNTWVCAG